MKPGQSIRVYGGGRMHLPEYKISYLPTFSPVRPYVAYSGGALVKCCETLKEAKAYFGKQEWTEPE